IGNREMEDEDRPIQESSIEQLNYRYPFSSDTMSQGDGVSERFHRNWKVYIAVLLIAVVSTAVFGYIYYSMSVASVTRVTLDQIQGVRIFGGGTYPNRNVTYILEVQVWSKAQTLD